MRYATQLAVPDLFAAQAARGNGPSNSLVDCVLDDSLDESMTRESVQAVST